MTDQSHFVVAIPHKGKGKKLVTILTERWGEGIVYSGIDLNTLLLYKQYSDTISNCVVLTLRAGAPLDFLHILIPLCRMTAPSIVSQWVFPSTGSQKGRRVVFILKTTLGAFQRKQQDFLALLDIDFAIQLFADYAQGLFEDMVAKFHLPEHVTIVHDPHLVLTPEEYHDYYAFYSFCEDEEACRDKLQALHSVLEVVSAIAFIQ